MPAKKAATRPDRSVDELGARVIELRSHPRSYAYIASELGMAHSRDAFAAFLQAVQSRPAREQRTLRTAESSRLDDLEKRTRKRSTPEQLDQKLAAIAQLRTRLMAGQAG